MRAVLVGGGGHASDVLSVIDALNDAWSATPHAPIEVVGLVADVEIDASRFAAHGLRQLGAISDLRRIDASHYIVAIGYSQPRKSVTERVADFGLSPIQLVHPRAYVATGAKLGVGVQILAGAVVSSTAEIGDHVLLHHNSVIGHDCRVGDFATVLPGATVSGDVSLGEACLIGSGAVIVEKHRVGVKAIVGAGAVVAKDVPAEVTAKGVPARF